MSNPTPFLRDLRTKSSVRSALVQFSARRLGNCSELPPNYLSRISPTVVFDSLHDCCAMGTMLDHRRFEEDQQSLRFFHRKRLASQPRYKHLLASNMRLTFCDVPIRHRDICL